MAKPTLLSKRLESAVKKLHAKDSPSVSGVSNTSSVGVLDDNIDNIDNIDNVSASRNREDETYDPIREEQFKSRAYNGNSDDTNYNNNDKSSERIGRSSKALDEIVLDELIASLPRNQGYYLKLSKECGPNEFEFKQRIDNYSGWSDMEYEIASIVRDHTKRNPNKWGSGRYQIIIWREGGMRGPKHRPIYFTIDAQELANGFGSSINVPIAQSESLTSTIGLIKQINDIQPKSISPEIHLEQLTTAFQKGASSQSSDISSNNTLITALITALTQAKPDQSISSILPSILTIAQNAMNTASAPVQPTNSLLDIVKVVKELSSSAQAQFAGAVQQQNIQPDYVALIEAVSSHLKPSGAPQTDPFIMLTKLKELGLFNSNSTAVQAQVSDPLEIITKMMPLMDRLTGGDSKPVSLLVECARILMPKLPEMVKDVTSTLRELNARAIVQQNVQQNTQQQTNLLGHPGANGHANGHPVTANLTTNNTAVKIEHPRSNGRPNPAVNIANDSINSEVSNTLSTNTLPTSMSTRTYSTDSNMFGSLASLLKNAIQTNNQAVYGQITHAIGFTLGDQYLLEIANGTLTTDKIIEVLSLLPEFSSFISNDIQTVSYITAYINWYRQLHQTYTTEQTAIAPTSIVVATCNICHEQYDVEHWNELTDEDKKCDNVDAATSTLCTGALTI